MQKKAKTKELILPYTDVEGEIELKVNYYYYAGFWGTYYDPPEESEVDVVDIVSFENPSISYMDLFESDEEFRTEIEVQILQYHDKTV